MRSRRQHDPRNDCGDHQCRICDAADPALHLRSARRHKATQPVEGPLTYGISEQLAELFRGNEGNTLGAEIARRAALPPPKPH